MANRATARDIINDSMAELGLPPATFSSALVDPNGYQAMALMNSLGEELVRLHDWQFLEKTVQYTGDGVLSEFLLPNDFGRQINQTQWDQSNRRPMQGPDNAQLWGWSHYGIVSVGIYYRYRILADKFQVFPTPAAGQQFAFYYITKNWVEDGSNAGTYKSKATTDADIPLFDRRLMICGLKAKFWSQKGFDNTVLMKEYDGILSAEKGQNQGAPVINLTFSDEHFLLNEYNVPDGTYYGSQ